MSRAHHHAVFAGESELFRATRESRARGLDIVDVFSPYPLHGIDEIVGIRRSRLPIVCFAGGLIGLSLGLWFQYWSSATNWPINVGGKPFDSLPAFIPVAFELTVLFGGLSTALMLLVRSRLWPGRRDRSIEGVTDDRFALVVTRPNASLSNDDVTALLQRNGAVEIWQEVRA